MVVEVGWVLTHILGPEWNARVKVTVSKTWKCIKLLCVWTIEKFAKPA